MSLNGKIDKDLLEALKARNELKVSTLRLLKAALKNYAIEKKVKELEDSDVIKLIKTQIKQRQDSIEAYRKGNRLDLVQKEERELGILKTYLPEELSPEELKDIISEVIKETSANSIKEMGKIIGLVMSKAAGRCDGRVVSSVVMEELKKIESKIE